MDTHIRDANTTPPPSEPPTRTAWCGLDMAKDTFEAHLLTPDAQTATGHFANDPTGHRRLLKWAQRGAAGASLHFCLEATGAYGTAVTLAIAEAGHTVSVVNAYQIHHFALSQGQGNKTDKADAQLIARYCCQTQPPAWRLAAPEVRDLVALVRHLSHLQQEATQHKNRLSEPDLVPAVAQSLQRLLTELQKEIAAIERRIDEHIDQHPTLKADRDLLLSIPAIGRATAAVILAELPDVQSFAAAQDAAKYAGLSPSQSTSGTSVRRRTALYRGGNRRLKAALYMPTLAAIRYNPSVHGLYQRLLAKGHKPMSALAAGMRKLLMVAFGVLRSRQPYRADYSRRPALPKPA